MAKVKGNVKTAKELKLEAEQLMQSALKQKKELLKKADDLEKEKMIELGKIALEFLGGNIKEIELRKFAISHDFIEADESELSSKKNLKDGNDE